MALLRKIQLLTALLPLLSNILTDMIEIGAFRAHHATLGLSSQKHKKIKTGSKNKVKNGMGGA